MTSRYVFRGSALIPKGLLAAIVRSTYYVRKETDGVHWHLVRCVGGQILAGAFLSWKMKSSGKVTHTVCHLLRIVPAIIVLFLVFQSRSMTPELLDVQHLEFAKYFCFAGLAFHILLLLVSGWPIGKAILPGNKIGDCLYQLDAIASICIGIAWLSFPNWLLHRQVIVPLDDSHSLCARLMGALFVSSYSVSTHALHWENQSDRLVAVDSRVVCCLTILSAQIWSQIAYTRDWSGGHWVGICLFFTWTFLSLVYRWSLSFRKAKKN
ncbi:unnamed protein product [Auanema sp. JU1783]|nr:unnamed protein product [Auanema sp. JU1783]